MAHHVVQINASGEHTCLLKWVDDNYEVNLNLRMQNDINEAQGEYKEDTEKDIDKDNDSNKTCSYSDDSDSDVNDHPDSDIDSAPASRPTASDSQR